MANKILVLDLDGTLLNSKKEISKENITAIKKAQDNGTTIVIATGRPLSGITKIVDTLGLKESSGYVLAFNGGLIKNCTTNETIYQKNISKNDIKEIYNVSKNFNVNIMTYSDTHVISENHDKYVQIETDICGIPFLQSDYLPDTITYDVPKCIMVDNTDYLASIEKQVADKLSYKFNVFRSEPFFLEIVPKGIDKALSLKILLEHLNMKKEDLIACGDGFNDLSMIEYAGIGVAMKNAQPEVKKVSDYITFSNDDNGIEHVINKFILKTI